MLGLETDRRMEEEVTICSLDLLLTLSRISRFHAWQSSLVFAALFIVHLVFSWSGFLSWLLFVADLALIAFLVFRAYRDGMWRAECPSSLFAYLLPHFVPLSLSPPSVYAPFLFTSVHC